MILGEYNTIRDLCQYIRDRWSEGQLGAAQRAGRGDRTRAKAIELGISNPPLRKFPFEKLIKGLREQFAASRPEVVGAIDSP